MNNFVDLLKTSVLLQAVITLVLLVTICIMYATKQAVPQELINFFAVILGFYFGSKVENVKARRL